MKTLEQARLERIISHLNLIRTHLDVSKICDAKREIDSCIRDCNFDIEINKMNDNINEFFYGKV